MVSHTSKERPPGAGRSSFDLVDAPKLFAELRLQSGSILLDLGCGQWWYAFAASPAIGPEGRIYALDLWEEGISLVKERAAAGGYRNLKALVADTSKHIPLATGSVDVCLMATVLHDLVEAHTAAGTLKETARVLKPGGTLAIVEFKKIAGPPGPPLHIRLAPEEVEKLVTPYGFRQDRITDVGPYNYLITFIKLIPSLKD
jgi:ubiquinone/menaquinone biosynthesis C-methylase UbiE